MKTKHPRGEKTSIMITCCGKRGWSSVSELVRRKLDQRHRKERYGVRIAGRTKSDLTQDSAHISSLQRSRS